MNLPPCLALFAYRAAGLAGSGRRGIPVLVIALWAFVGPSFVHTSQAALRYYVAPTPQFGAYNSTFSWSNGSGGASGASVPGPSDEVIFDQPNVYNVYFFGTTPANVLNMDVLAGDYTLQLGGATSTVTTDLNGIEVGVIPGGTARLTVVNGVLKGDTIGDDVQIGRSSATGYLTLDVAGQLGTSALRSDVTVGGADAGTGFLTVQTSGKAYTNTLDVGRFAGSEGTVAIAGPATLVDATTVSVGYGGVGAMTVANGGRVVNSGPTYVGRDFGSSGALSVDGVGSSVTTGGFNIGYQGVGSLLVQGGGSLTSSGASMALLPTGFATATVTGAGSMWRDTTISTRSLGYGDVTLNVLDGGRVEFTSGSTILGVTGRTRAKVDGVGSQWLVEGLTVADNADGTLVVSNGGNVTAGGPALKIADSAAGASVGVVDVVGAGAKLTTAGTIFVGDGGTGTLRVRDGGEVNTYFDVSIRNGTTGSGTVVVDGGTLRAGPLAGGDLTINAGGSLSFNGGTIEVGDDFINAGTFSFGDGSLQVLGDFQHSAVAGEFRIDGGVAADLPSLTLLGNGATTNVTSLVVGRVNRGALQLRQGRQVTLSGDVTIGANPGADGTVVVDSGAKLTASLVKVGNSGLPGGTGLLEVGPGGTVDAVGVFVGSDGRVRLNGGTIRTQGFGFASGFEWTTGTLEFNFLDTNFYASFVGDDGALNAGQVVKTSAAGQLVRLLEPITVAGGQLTPHTLTNNTTLQITSGMARAINNATNNYYVFLANPLAVFGASAGTTVNNGIIRGTGRISGALTNSVAAHIEVISGERLVLEGSLLNSGHTSIIGGELQVDGSATNAASTGLISARDAILRFGPGLANGGSLAFSNGTVDFYGDVTQVAGGRITVSGGGIANFYDDVTIGAGAANVQATALGSTVSKVVFFGSYNGGVSGGGQAFIEGDHRPGNSPASVDFDGDLFYGPFSTLEIELGGLLAGTQHDQIRVDGDLALGGALDVSLIGGYTLGFGQEYLIADVGGSLLGEFAGLGEGALVGNFTGRDLFITYAAGDGNDVALFTVPTFTADFDEDGDVDGTDLTFWRAGFGGANVGHMQGDADADGDADGADFLAWQRQFGSGLFATAASTAAVPEPAAVGLFAAALGAAGVWGRKRRRP